MSPSLSESLRIGFCPDRVTLARYGRGLRPRPLEKGTFPLEPGTAREPWRAPALALPKLLQAQPQRSAGAVVVLSNHFVRYLLLHADARVSSREEWLEYASHHYEKTYGARARDWDIQISGSGAGKPRLASAIEKALLAELAAAFRGTRVRLRSIQPYLMVAFNRALPGMEQSSFWFVVHEPDRLLLGLIRDGWWRSVRSRQTDAKWREELPQTLEREGALIAPEEPCRDVLVCAPGAGAPVSANGFNFAALPSRASGEDHAYAMVCA